MAVHQEWSSQRAFVLAAVGSAIGLGNLIRFPYVCASHGGGAFLVAYLVAMASAGLPLMLVELGLGHRAKGSAPFALSRVDRRLEWAGWMATGLGFIIVAYYAVIMAWAFVYLLDAGDIAQWGATIETANEHFFSETLGLSDGPTEPGGLRTGLIAGVVLVWVAVILSVWQGVKTVGKVVYATVLIPWALLLLLVVRALFLPGATDGLAWYLTPVWSQLLDGEVWLAAYAQTFFSLSVGYAIMPAYAACLSEDADLTRSAITICLADAATAVIGGLAVFGCAGYLAGQEGIPVTELLDRVEGLKLAFVTYPNIIAQLPGSVAFGAVFFATLLMLGIDSAFSMLEAVTSSIRDKFGIGQKAANFAVAIPACLAGLPFITGAGLYWIDTTDYFMNHFGLPIVCIAECVAVAWFLQPDRLREYLEERSKIRLGQWFAPTIKLLIPIVLLILVGFEARQRWLAPYQGYPRSIETLWGWLALAVPLMVGLGLSRLGWRRDLS